MVVFQVYGKFCNQSIIKNVIFLFDEYCVRKERCKIYLNVLSISLLYDIETHLRKDFICFTFYSHISSMNFKNSLIGL